MIVMRMLFGYDFAWKSIHILYHALKKDLYSQKEDIQMCISAPHLEKDWSCQDCQDHDDATAATTERSWSKWPRIPRAPCFIGPGKKSTGVNVRHCPDAVLAKKGHLKETWFCQRKYQQKIRIASKYIKISPFFCDHSCLTTGKLQPVNRGLPVWQWLGPRCNMCNWVVLFVGFFECVPLFSIVFLCILCIVMFNCLTVCSVLLSLLWFSSVSFLGGLVCIGFGWFRLVWWFLFLGYLVWVWRRLGIQDHQYADDRFWYGAYTVKAIHEWMSIPSLFSFLSFLSLFLSFLHYFFLFSTTFISTTKFAWSCIQRLRKCNWCLTTVLADFQHSQSNLITSMMRTSTHSSGGSWTMQENMTIWPHDDPGLSRFWWMTNHDWLLGGFKHVLRSPNLRHDDPIWVA